MIKTFPVICGSAAGNPSSLGVKLHNAGYKALGLDWSYIAMGASSVEEVITSFKTLSFRGLGVSMPFKQDIIKYLDEIDDSVMAIGACNTVFNARYKDGNDTGKDHLIGYNTDWVGARDAIQEVVDLGTIKTGVIIGAGGVARAIAYALKKSGIEVYISARKKDQRDKLVRDLELKGAVRLEEQGTVGAQLVVNATPIADPNGPLVLQEHKNAQVIFDVVFQSAMTELTTAASNMGLKVVPGWRMLLLQGVKQLEIYTGMKAPVFEMSRVLEEWLKV